MKHLDKREFFSSDEKFANFRSLILNNKKSKMFFRSASATRNIYGRMETVNKIMRNKSIKTTIDLTYIEYRCFSDEFGYELVNQFCKILAEEGPYVIQCDSGKKRTGFASIVLEMLSGTNYSLIVQDYIESYVNNNGVSVIDDCDVVEKIRKQKIDRIIQFISGAKESILETNFVKSAELYLLKYGFDEYEILKLHKKLKQ